MKKVVILFEARSSRHDSRYGSGRFQHRVRGGHRAEEEKHTSRVNALRGHPWVEDRITGFEDSRKEEQSGQHLKATSEEAEEWPPQKGDPTAALLGAWWAVTICF